MRPEDYPAQEPLSEVAAAYQQECFRRAEGVTGEDIAYGDDPYQTIQIVPAAEPTGDVLAFIHGGGWTNGYKEWMSFMAPALNARGVTFATIGYRLAPKHLFPVGYEDALDGVAEVHRRIADFGGDPDRLFVGGHSAGGHYAALMAVTDQWQAPRGLPADVIRGCLPVSGVYDFRPGNGMSVRPRFLGPEDSGTEEPASPIANIRRTPPFLISFGEKDFPHLIKQAEAFETEIRGRGADVTRIFLPGCNHFEANYAAGDPDGPWVGPAADWMRSH